MTYKTEGLQRLMAFFEDNPDKAFTTAEICDALLTDGKGKSSIYRLINRLREDGEIRTILSADKTVSYQYIGGATCRNHLHLKCDVCGRVVHLSEDFSKAICGMLEKSELFKVNSGGIIFGKCEFCKQEVTL